MSTPRNTQVFNTLSAEQNRVLLEKIDQKIQETLAILPASPFKETLQKALKTELIKSIGIRNHHAELAKSWHTLVDAAEYSKQASHFVSLMQNAQVKSYFNVLEHLHPGQDFYHTTEHSGEMRMDNPIQAIDRSSAENMLINNFRAKAGADHDIIQGDSTPLQNEIKSAAINENDNIELLRQLRIQHLSDNEIKELAQAIAQPINDHTFLILGKTSLAALRQEIEEAFFSQEELHERNKNLYFQNAIGYALEFSDINRAAYDPITSDKDHARKLATLEKETKLPTQPFNDFIQQQGLSEGPKVSMLIGQGMRMMPEMHNKFRYDLSKPGQAELNFPTRKGLSLAILKALKIDKVEQAPSELQPLFKKLESSLSVAELRQAVQALEKDFPALKPFAYLYTLPEEQKALKQMMHDLRLYALNGEKKYLDAYLNNLDKMGPLLAKIYVNSTVSPLGSNDVGFSLDRDIQKLVSDAARVGVSLGDSTHPVDTLAHTKQALLLDKSRAIPELEQRLKKESDQPSREQLEKTLKEARVSEDLITFYQHHIQDDPSKAKAMFHQLMLQTACQQGFYEQQRFILSNLGEVEKELAKQRESLTRKDPERVQILDAMIQAAKLELGSAYETRKELMMNTNPQPRHLPSTPTTIGITLQPNNQKDQELENERKRGFGSRQLK